MASLLSRIHITHFLLDLAKPLDIAPQLEGCICELVEPKVLSVGVPKQKSLNDLFAQLSAQNIEVISLKNKSNRLEQLFMDIVQ
jgi:ABC-2 type transport system ATP-binding protein